MSIRLDPPARYQFASTLLATVPRDLARVNADPAAQAIQVDHPVLQKLLAHLAATEVALLPCFGSDTDTWLLAAARRRDMETLLARVSHFIAPTFAEFSAGEPAWQLFDPASNPLQQLGAALYPAGYYRWQSPAHFRSQVLDHLGLLVSLLDRRPLGGVAQQPTYQELLDRFEAALAAWNWTEANQVLLEVERRHLSTAENLAFLQVHLLAQQQRWAEIWTPDYQPLVQIQVPRAVQAALLTAFHHSVLLPMEQAGTWEQAIACFAERRAELGRQLQARRGLNQGPVRVVFGYLAVQEEDREGFEALLNASDDPAVQATLASLAPYLPAPMPLSVPPAYERAITALWERNLDLAWEAASQIGDTVQRSVLWVEIALMMKDPACAEAALLAFWDLSDETQRSLRESDTRLPLFLSYLEGLTGPPHAERGGWPADWEAWFQALVRDPSNPSLPEALDHLMTTQDDRYWTPVWAEGLADNLLNVLTDTSLLERRYVRRALQHFVSTFLQDAQFPRTGAAYEALYDALYHSVLQREDQSRTPTLTLLRLADARLRAAPDRCEEIATHLERWFERPTAQFENEVQEAFDLLASCGLPGARLMRWCRTWLTHLLGLPTRRDEVALATWLALAEWIQPGVDLIERLKQEVQAVAAAAAEVPWARLPAGYKIGIFTLRLAAAERVRTLLCAHNPGLEVQICSDTVMTGAAGALAAGSNMVVLVTTAMTHSLYYGIKPHLAGQIVYPESMGSSSILREIEKALSSPNTVEDRGDSHPWNQARDQ